MSAKSFMSNIKMDSIATGVALSAVALSVLMLAGTIEQSNAL